MITVALVADTGQAMETMTRAALGLPGVHIVRHCSGRTPVGEALRRFAPDLIVVDEMHWPKLALQRIAEARTAVPAARIVVYASRPEAGWLGDALREGADAVVPVTAGADTLAVVLSEVFTTAPIAA
jgi:DNA-binding NarL/FixJ family response regulator